MMTNYFTKDIPNSTDHHFDNAYDTHYWGNKVIYCYSSPPPSYDGHFLCLLSCGVLSLTLYICNVYVYNLFVKVKFI